MALGGGVHAFLAAIALLSLGVSAFKAGMNTLLINAAPHAQAGRTLTLTLIPTLPLTRVRRGEP